MAEEWIELDALAEMVVSREEQRCVRWDKGGCPEPRTGRSCEACGGCCNWPSSVHLTPRQVEELRQPGLVVEAPIDSVLQDWKVLPGSRLTFGEVWVPVRPHGLPPRGPGEYALTVVGCGAVGFWYVEERSGGSGGATGGVWSLRVVRRAAVQERLL